jgi:signal transduction histidine kinase
VTATGSASTLQALRATPLFADLPDPELAELAAMCDEVQLAPGERLLEEGSPGDACFVIVDGELEVTKRSGTTQVPLAVIGPGAITGEMSLIEERPRNATVTAQTAATALRVPRTALLEVLGRPGTALIMLRTVMGRLRSTEGLLREREKLAGLGTLAAGLAHELNNPAAALRRSVIALDEAVARAESSPRPSPPPQPPADAVTLTPLERADAIDEISELTGGDAEAAGALVDVGWTVDALRAQPPDVLPWVAADASVHSLMNELHIAAERISEIVGAVKGYAYLDQAPVQRVDVRHGLEQTLVILRHRLKEGGVTVERGYADELPEIEAYGSELNQVWTNLVDNAVDAMGGSGTLTVAATPSDAGGVVVTVCDTGPGIPAEIRGRVFEPFFTTKPPGSGTGLGLHISHQVVARHAGRIEIDSEPGRNCFTVTLPAQIPR